MEPFDPKGEQLVNWRLVMDAVLAVLPSGSVDMRETLSALVRGYCLDIRALVPALVVANQSNDDAKLDAASLQLLENLNAFRAKLKSSVPCCADRVLDVFFENLNTFYSGCIADLPRAHEALKF